MRPRPHSQIVMRIGNTEVVEEAVRHVAVIVLTGVDDDVLEFVFARECTVQWGELHEVGASADYREDTHVHFGRLKILSFEPFVIWSKSRSL